MAILLFLHFFFFYLLDYIYEEKLTYLGFAIGVGKVEYRWDPFPLLPAF